MSVRGWLYYRTKYNIDTLYAEHRAQRGGHGRLRAALVWKVVKYNAIHIIRTAARFPSYNNNNSFVIIITIIILRRHRRRCRPPGGPATIFPPIGARTITSGSGLGRFIAISASIKRPPVLRSSITPIQTPEPSSHGTLFVYFTIYNSTSQTTSLSDHYGFQGK